MPVVFVLLRPASAAHDDTSLPVGAGDGRHNPQQAMRGVQRAGRSAREAARIIGDIAYNCQNLSEAGLDPTLVLALAGGRGRDIP